MAVLVTGGAGYIGSHMVYALVDRGEDVVVLDDLSTGIESLVAPKARFVQGCIGDRRLVQRLILDYGVDAALHFAGSTIVPESMQHPIRYYANNTIASRDLIATCIAGGLHNFLFSSTAAIYGNPAESRVSESSPTRPINPYGQSKLMTEWVLEDTAKAHDFRYFALRYFNVAGADPGGRTGQSTPRATHLIKRACQVAVGCEPHLDIFGTDYPTPDGTAIRDYIHVVDLVEAHLLALDALRKGQSSAIYNCGYGRGYSVREVVAAVERASGRVVPVHNVHRRAGDPTVVVADPGLLQNDLPWRPRYADLDVIVESALTWERRCRDN